MTSVIKEELLVLVPPQGGYVAGQCSKRASNDHDPAYDPALKVDDTPLSKSLMEGGKVFESEIGEKLCVALGDKIGMVDNCDRTEESKSKREAQTLEFMRNPGEVVLIWNARLPVIKENDEESILPRVGEPDFLVRLNKKEDGNWAWAPGDVKHHKSLEGASKNKLWKVSTFDNPLLDSSEPKDIGPGNVKLKPNLQLAHYRRILEEIGFAQDVSNNDPYWAAVIGKEEVLVWRDLDEVGRSHTMPDATSGKFSSQEIYDTEYAWRIEVIRRARTRYTDPSVAALVGPEWKDECKSCSWREVCHDELKLDLDHITLIPGITPDKARPHYANGVRTVGALARLDYRTAVAIDYDIDVRSAVAEAQVANLSEKADLILRNHGANDEAVQALELAGVVKNSDIAAFDFKTSAYFGTKVNRLADAIDQARVMKVQKAHRARNTEYVQIPRAAIEIDVDIEDSNGHVYLIGARARGYRKRGGDEKLRFEMHSFVTWEGTEDAEAKVFADFWTYIQGMIAYSKANKYGLRVFHYTRHEDQAFLELAKRHAGKTNIPSVDDVQAFLSSDYWVDLYPIVSKQLIWPTEEKTLKKLAGYVGFLWRDEAPGGDNSIAWYKEAHGNESSEVREEFQNRIIAYNEDDVQAQLEIRDWINRFGETRKPGLRLPSAEKLDRRFSRRALNK